MTCSKFCMKKTSIWSKIRTSMDDRNSKSLSFSLKAEVTVLSKFLKLRLDNERYDRV